MRLTLISPRLALQKGDFLGSGVPYWPVELVTLAAFARDKGDAVTLLDLFGNDPACLTDMGDYYLQGQPVTMHLAGEAARGAMRVVTAATAARLPAASESRASRSSTHGSSGLCAASVASA